MASSQPTPPPAPVLPRRSTGTLPPPPYDSQEDLQPLDNPSASTHLLPLARSHGYVTPHAPNSVNGSRLTEPYPRPDPFTEALRHTESLQELYARYKDSDRQRAFRMGELVGGLTQLLQKARQLDALDVEEEQEQLQDLIT